ncbi:GntR family transcriptional regulator [Pseudonocardia benzenivorans]
MICLVTEPEIPTHRTKSELALRVLRERIRSGQLEVGYRLQVDELAAELGMSPTPIRRRSACCRRTVSCTTSRTGVSSSRDTRRNGCLMCMQCAWRSSRWPPGSRSSG